MLQTELTNSVCSSDINGKGSKSSDMIKRIEELNKWQEEQKKLLESRQRKQRQALGLEQQTMYRILGLQNQLISESNIENCDTVDSLDMKKTEKVNSYKDEKTRESLVTTQLDYVEGFGEKPSLHRDSTTGYVADDHMTMHQIKPTRPFLRRGEGLKKRFKIDPNDLMLNNLPKYKYANAHSRLRLKLGQKICDRKSFNSVNAENYTITNTLQPVAHLDVQEQRFQNLLITSKNNCSSTPATKSSVISDSESASFKVNPFSSAKINDIQDHPKTKVPQVHTQVIAWSKILDPLEIEPIQVPRNSKQILPETEQSIFELLEQKANDGSFDMNSTCLKEFMTRRSNEKLDESDDIIPVEEDLKTKRLNPIILAAEESPSKKHVEASKEDSTHKTMETTNSTHSQETSQVKVRFCESNETHEYEEELDCTLNDTSYLSSDVIVQESEDDTTKTELFIQFKEALFAALQIKADQHLANETTLNSASDTTLTPQKSVSVSNLDDSHLVNSSSCKELQEKTNLLKTRLAELEKEIQDFKENNIVLLKAKQEHELQKSIYAQEHLEAMERLKDEKIQMEIYLHDERVKLEDEKRKFDQNMKMKTQGVIAKERKECAHLKEQVAQLQTQLKSKETTHTAAQARLRTQIRNMEREQSKLYEQIENLRRENKRLESENLKISREQNNKILLEINRNIAKLAPKQIPESSTDLTGDSLPTLGFSRTLPKSIISTTNKGVAKDPKPTNKRFSKIIPKIPPSTVGCKVAELLPESSVVAEKQTNIINLDEDDDDDEDDILKEFQIPMEKDKVQKVSHNTNNQSLNKPLCKSQNDIPLPPPSSPRSCTEYSNNMKREILNSDGSKDIWYPNGNLKKISGDGMIIRMLYYNKDIKETNINEGTIKYYYSETNTWHTTYLDGLEILEFPNGQIEHRHKNGVVEVHYPNNSVRITDPKDDYKQEEWRFPDGTQLVQMRNGDKILSLPNGQKEIHNRLHKRREYPDGTVKIVYPDGSTETRYSNGRIRLKDKEGKLVIDTDTAK